MKPLDSQKQLLIAESEINRAELRQEWQTMVENVRGLAGKARSLNVMALSMAGLVAGVAALTSRKPAPAAGKSSWLQKIARGIRLASTIWLLFRSRGSNSEKK